MNTRTLLYAFLAFQAIHAAANNQPPTNDELVEAVRSVTPDDAYDVLHMVCESGHHELVEELMRKPAFLFGTGGAGRVVAWAVHFGYPNAVDAVMRALDSPKQDYLVEACREGHADLVEALLADPTVDPAADNQAALIAACTGGHVPVVEHLCSLGAVEPRANGYQPVRLAISLGHIGLLRYMLTCPRRDEFLKPGSRMPVFEAMRKGRLEALVMLMEGGHEESHALLDAWMKQVVQLKITDLAPDAVRACIAGDLGALQDALPELVVSMDELDVLLGMSRHHPDLLAFLKDRQYALLQEDPGFAQIMHAERHLVTYFEGVQVYKFLIGRQYRFLKTFLEAVPIGPDNLHVLEEHQQLELQLELLMRGFKRIEPRL